MSMVRNIKTYLISKGVCEHVFLGSMPDDETECIAICKNKGQSLLYDAGIKRTGLKIRCRSSNYEDAAANMRLVCSMLWEIGNKENDYGSILDIDGTKYIKLCPVQSAYCCECDKNGEYELVQDFDVYTLLKAKDSSLVNYNSVPILRT